MAPRARKKQERPEPEPQEVPEAVQVTEPEPEPDLGSSQADNAADAVPGSVLALFAPEAEDEGEAAAEPGEFDTFEMFCANMSGALRGAGHATGLSITARVAPRFYVEGGLETLKRAPDDPLFQDAMRPLYDLCLETPWLHTLIRSGEFFGKWAALIMFGGQIAVGVSNEIAAKRPKPAPESAAVGGDGPEQQKEMKEEPQDGATL